MNWAHETPPQLLDILQLNSGATCTFADRSTLSKVVGTPVNPGSMTVTESPLSRAMRGVNDMVRGEAWPAIEHPVLLDMPEAGAGVVEVASGVVDVEAAREVVEISKLLVAGMAGGKPHSSHEPTSAQ